ncbi:hypothetical protein SK128_012579 [Halocaridina rubra]|uniref:Uncharacterized protein n=1 Tax=Halocaridina rubra TaxID=373956 RepID=A0AAN8WBQ5_HALRR
MEEYMKTDNLKNSSHMLSLTACYDWEYSCGDGTCVNLTQRCDLRVDCPDNTDETACGRLIKPEDYLDALPPPSIKPGPLEVNINISIRGFSEIDIRDMKLVIDFTLVMSWSESRVRFKNLRNMADLNYIEKQYYVSGLAILFLNLFVTSSAVCLRKHRCRGYLAKTSSCKMFQMIQKPKKSDITPTGLNGKRKLSFHFIQIKNSSSGHLLS